MAVLVAGRDAPQWCSYCGKELEEEQVVTKSTPQWTDIVLVCPDYKEPSLRTLWRESKHSIWVWDSMRTIQNFDPYTGRKVKSDCE